jgi:hypothetical protein
MKLTWKNRSTWGKTFPSATLSTTNPTWTDPRSNTDLRDEGPLTKRLSHGTAHYEFIVLGEKKCQLEAGITLFYFV